MSWPLVSDKCEPLLLKTKWICHIINKRQLLHTGRVGRIHRSDHSAHRDGREKGQDPLRAVTADNGQDGPFTDAMSHQA